MFKYLEKKNLKFREVVNLTDKEDLPGITLEDETDEVEEEFIFNPEFNKRIEGLHNFLELSQYMYPESKDAECPAIMSDVEAFRYGFKYPESEFRNLTKSTLTKILKNFLDFGELSDSLFMLGNIRFLTQLFDIEDVKEQVKAYLVSPYIIKSDEFILALERLLKRESRISNLEKQVVKELLEFLK